MKPVTCVLTIGLFLLPATSVGAEEIVLNAIDQGWFAQGSHTAANENTLTGRGFPFGIYRSFFVFDLTNETGLIVGGELRLELEDYSSASPSEPFTVYDVDATAAELNMDYGFDDPDGLAIYDDLGSGSVYATSTVESSDQGSVIVIPVSEQAIFDLNVALGADFAVGLDLDSPDDGGGPVEFIRFSVNDEPGIQQLVLTRQCTPPEVTELRVHGAVSTTVTWTEQIPGLRYDVAGAVLSDLPRDGGVANAECLEEDTSIASFTDPRLGPESGEGYYYIVRAQHDCTGSYGYATSGAERLPIAACF